jgi:peptidoglycan/xylan/chitin deacetylase (PgdA/CDA1 family)
MICGNPRLKSAQICEKQPHPLAHLSKTSRIFTPPIPMDMKPKMLLALMVLLALSLQFSYGQVVTDTVTDYGIIHQTILEKVQKYGAEQVLVVMDIDNTILASDTDLGSDFWYQWQSDKLPLKPRPDQKLDRDCLFGEAISLLYELGTMSLTDSLLPGYIQGWQNSGVTVIALTSRNPQCRPATERDLELCGIDLSLTSLRTADGREVPYVSPADSNLSYEHGIFMTTGADKGKKLADIIERSVRSFKSIIMVDDTPKNIVNVNANASNYGAGELVLFFYTKINTDRLAENENKIFTEEQAERMDEDWDRLIRELNAIFPERINKSICSKRICISIDDLPLVSYGISDSLYQKALVAKLVGTLKENNIPAIGFVNEGKLYEDGMLIPFKVGMLKTWVNSGLELGNHTFSHPDYNKVPLKEFTEDLIKGETVSKQILAEQGKFLKYFRHPYLHVGNTREKADSLSEFLAGRGYSVAPVTIDDEDYLFAKAYHAANRQQDIALMDRIGSDYLSYMEKKLVYFEGQSDSLFGRNISQVLLIHASLLNADYLGQLIDIYRDHNYFFVSIDQALQDPAFLTPVTVYGNWGISWLDLWALSRGKKGAFFKNDPVTPEYIREMAE